MFFLMLLYVVEQYGDEWVCLENIQINGVFCFVDWWMNNYVYLVCNESFYDNENVCFDEVFFYLMVDNSVVSCCVCNGEFDLNMEFLGQQFEFLQCEIFEYVCVYLFMGMIYFFLNMMLDQFEDLQVCNVLGMVIDCEFIVEEIFQVGQLLVYFMVFLGVVNYLGGVEVNWVNILVEQCCEIVCEILEVVGYGLDNLLCFEYIYCVMGDNLCIVLVVQNDWFLIVEWVELVLIVNDIQIYYDNLCVGDFQVVDGGWIVDYNDLYNFFFFGEFCLVLMNYLCYNNFEYDVFVFEVNCELDLMVCGQMMVEVEQMMMDDMLIILIVFYVNKVLVSLCVIGWVDNVVNIYCLCYICFNDLDNVVE